MPQPGWAATGQSFPLVLFCSAHLTFEFSLSAPSPRGSRWWWKLFLFKQAGAPWPQSLSPAQKMQSFFPPPFLVNLPDATQKYNYL